MLYLLGCYLYPALFEVFSSSVLINQNELFIKKMFSLRFVILIQFSWAVGRLMLLC